MSPKSLKKELLKKSKKQLIKKYLSSLELVQFEQRKRAAEEMENSILRNALCACERTLEKAQNDLEFKDRALKAIANA